MESHADEQQVIQFNEREATVLADVFVWADRVDLEEHIDYVDFSEDVLPRIEQQLQEEQTFDPSLLEPSVVPGLMSGFADELRHHVMSDEDRDEIFAFYEDVFESIEDTFDGH